MNTGIINEKWRATQLKDKLALNMDIYVTEEYPATAIHLNSTMIDANQTCLDMFGYSIEELTGFNAWRFFSEKSVPIIMDKLVNKIEEPYRVVAVKKDGTEFEIELKGTEMELDGYELRLVQIKKLD